MGGRDATRGARRCWRCWRCWRAGWRGDRTRDHIDRRCPDEAARPLDRKRRAEPGTPVEARTAAPGGALRGARCGARCGARAAQGAIRREGWAESAERPARRWPARRRRLRPRGDAVADHGAVEALPRARLPSAAAARHPSARAPTVHRDTDCRPHRNRGTARHWCGCGEWGVCVRSFENCEWYSGLRSDLEGSATPPQA